MPELPDWMDFSTEYVDPDTGFKWFVDCLGATSVNQAEADNCTLQFHRGDIVRYGSADPSNLHDSDELARAFKSSSPKPPK